MTRYMLNFGEPIEFEATTLNGIFHLLKKYHNSEAQDEREFMANFDKFSQSWCGKGLKISNREAFVTSMIENGLLVCLSEQTKEFETDLMARWSRDGFLQINRHLSKPTSRQVKACQKMAEKFSYLAENMDANLFEQIRSCKSLDGYHNNRYEYLSDTDNPTLVVELLNFVIRMLKEEVRVNHAAKEVFDAVYTTFPYAVADYAILWQFTLGLPMGSEFLKSTLAYLSDSIGQYPGQSHEMIANYVPQQEILKCTRLYFAYGSNMDHQQMKQRCPSAQFLGLSDLKNFKYYIDARGVASLAPNFGSTTWGIVWDIQDDQDWNTLDRYEGVSSSLYKRLSAEIDFSGKLETCEIYISSTPEKGEPRLGYQENIVKSLKFHLDWCVSEHCRLGNETFLEKVLDGNFNYAFGLWHDEMSSWLGENR